MACGNWIVTVRSSSGAMERLPLEQQSGLSKSRHAQKKPSVQQTGFTLADIDTAREAKAVAEPPALQPVHSSNLG